MTADRWTHAVRRQLGFDRLLPLGDPADGAWIAQSAVRTALAAAAREVRGVRLGALRVILADPAGGTEPSVPAPPGALAPGPLRMAADFASTATAPLPDRAERLRTVLVRAAVDVIGLRVEAVDLRVTELLDDETTGPTEPAAPTEPTEPTEPSDATKPGEDLAPDDVPPEPDQEPDQAPDQEPGQKPDQTPPAHRLSDDEATARAAAAAVPGVARLTGTLGGLGRAVHIEPGTARDGAAALARRHVRIELAVAPGHRVLDVALAVRRSVAEALPDRPTVAAVVTAID